MDDTGGRKKNIFFKFSPKANEALTQSRMFFNFKPHADLMLLYNFITQQYHLLNWVDKNETDATGLNI